MKYRLLVTLIVAGSTGLDAQQPQIAQATRLFEDSSYAEAKAVLQPIAARDASAAFLMGKIELQLDEPSKAADWLEKAVSMNPRSSVYYDWLGKAYGVQAQKASKLKQPFLAKKTKAAWEKAIALDPDNLEARSDIIQYYLQAPSFLGGSKDKARAEAVEIRKRNPYRGFIAAANVCAAIKDQPCVERELQTAVREFADSAATHTALASFYTTAKQYDKAFAVLDQRLKSKPGDAAAMYSYGRVASISGLNLERGEQGLRAYISAPLPNGPAVANAHYRLGMIQEKKGAKDLARKEYQVALQLNPKLEDARKALAGLGR